MPEKSGFFDSTATDIRAYPAREFAEYFSRFIKNGIFSGGTFLKVVANGTDANVSIQTGYGWINGYLYGVYDTALTLPIQAATTLDRIDRVVLRLDVSAAVRSIKAVVLQGTPSTTPTAPSLTRSGDVYDLSLAQVRVNANTSIVTPSNITDERLNNDVCGIVTGLIDQANTTSIFNQFQAFLDLKTAEYQLEWEAFIESVQDEGFATTQYVDNRVLTGGYGATTNSSNAYSVILVPAPTALVAGLRATIRINAANTGAATLNVNGLGAKSILKSNGTSVTSGFLKVNSVYSVVYNGTAFILQGEGGEYGTAVASDVLVGKTIGTESGLISGTMPNRSAESAHQLALSTEVWQGDRVFFMPPDGYFNGQSWVYVLTPDLLPSNIRSGKSILGVAGTLNEGPKYATGTVSRTNTQHKFTLPSGNPAYDRYKITVTGLAFRPNRIIVYSQSWPDRDVIGIYDRGSLSAGGYSFTKLFEGSTVSFYRLYENSANGGVDEAWVSDQGFQLPMYSTNTANSTITWEAFQV